MPLTRSSRARRPTAFGAFFKGSSADGTRVFFETAEGLVIGDTDGQTDVYERSGGTTTLVSSGQINGNGQDPAFFSGAIPDGTRVWFRTLERLAPGDTDSRQDVYERSNGQTFVVSRGAINGNGNFDADFAGASTDGSRVFFHSQEQLVSGDTDSQQLDVYQFAGGAVQQLSTGPVNGNTANNAFFSGASADGTRVFFQTSAKLVNADTDANSDIYERAGGVTTRISSGAINGNGANSVIFERASADGFRVFFRTAESLVSTDTDVVEDVYQRFAGTTTRVSVGNINGNGAFPASSVGSSADGTRLFFATAEPLLGADTDTRVDIYERIGGSTHVVSIGDGAFDALFRGCSTDGRALFFGSAEKILANDKDAVDDIYGAYSDI